jgi:hypothetical protein
MNNLSLGTERKAEIPTAKKDQTERRYYRFFSFDTGGRIVLAEDHECDSDRSAVLWGKISCRGRIVRKWRFGSARRESAF